MQFLSPLTYHPIPFCIALHHLYSSIPFCFPYLYSPTPICSTGLFRSLYCTPIPIPMFLFLLDSLICALCRTRILKCFLYAENHLRSKVTVFLLQNESGWLIRPIPSFSLIFMKRSGLVDGDFLQSRHFDTCFGFWGSCSTLNLGPNV